MLTTIHQHNIQSLHVCPCKSALHFGKSSALPSCPLTLLPCLTSGPQHITHLQASLTETSTVFDAVLIAFQPSLISLRLLGFILINSVIRYPVGRKGRYPYIWHSALPCSSLLLLFMVPELSRSLRLEISPTSPLTSPNLQSFIESSSLAS